MNIFEVDGKMNKAKLAKDILIPVAGGMVTGFLAAKNAKKNLENFKEAGWFPSILDHPGHVDMFGEKGDT
ncbi:hypothetical protein FZC84_17705 [Rossellomorea vietnamensis]|uniref:Uncharacterized protein n=1 Tax=Rossellomorea vietnamensis TaxID=218284 RepID=A0A5D4M869_9BACI|nr:hypothetical protein [Rossellomorea vietnamensis]TYR97852.1 hypothetical protein FZC84_17705 [Rossellomorea vietnamensis]